MLCNDMFTSKSLIVLNYDSDEKGETEIIFCETIKLFEQVFIFNPLSARQSGFSST